MKKFVTFIMVFALITTLFTAQHKVEASTGHYVVKVDTKLNVREKPSPKAKVVGSLKNSTVVYVYNTVPGGWSKIKFNNKAGYVASSYLIPEGIKAKVFPVIYLSEGKTKFPVKLSNGLEVSTEEWEGLGSVPIVEKDGNEVWSTLEQNPINPDGVVQFTVTTSGDTFLYYHSGASGGSGSHLVGVHANGKVFLRKDFISGIAVETKFIAVDKLEVSYEIMNPKWDPAKHSNAARHSGIWDVTVYKLHTSGKMTVEKKFVRKQ